MQLALAAVPRIAEAAAATAAADLPWMIDDSDNATGAGGADLYLEVSVNAMNKGLAHFTWRDGELWASKAGLVRLGFALPADATDPVRLTGLRGVHIDYDARRQTVALVAPIDQLKLGTTVLGPSSSLPSVATTSPGLLLNYDVYGTRGQHDIGSLNAFAELRAFNDWGVLSSTELAQDNDAGHGVRQGHSVRLDTNWSTSFPAALLTLHIGDTFTQALSWSRATRIGGLQFGTNFSLQPSMVTAPLSSFVGSATLPSDIQLFVDGLRQYSGQVPAGPFQLDTIPSISGAGNAQVVLTNVLGQTTTMNYSMYGESQLLRRGLSDWSVETGFVRQNYGLDSFDYGHDPIISGSGRYGVTDKLTVEGHAEAARGLVDEGAGGVLLLGRAAGVLTASLAFSEGTGQAGRQYSMGYKWSNSRFNFGATAIRTMGSYSDAAASHGSPLPSLSAQAFVGYDIAYVGSVGMSYLDLKYPQRNITFVPSNNASDPNMSRYVNAYWSRSFGRSAAFNFSVSDDLQNSRNRTISLGAIFSFDSGITVSSGLQRANEHMEATENAARSLPSQGGFGWRASLDRGEGQNGGLGELSYLGRHGQMTAGVQDVADSRYAYASALGSLVLIGGEAFAAPQITGGFALVSVDGVAGVPVSLQNNLVGVTDSRGLLLVTPLTSYQANKISIDPMNLPVDVKISSVSHMATPADRAGISLRFDITPIRAASIALVDGAGKPLPIGSQVHLRGHAGDPALVGFDGSVYLDTLDPHNVLDVTTSSGSCHVDVDYREQDEGALIGPLTCQEASS